jgi:general secretion pathway protein G
MSPFHSGKKAGFTLMELMVVIAIVGTLAAIAVPIAGTYIDRVRVIRAISEIRTIEGEIDTFAMDNNRYPNDLSEIGLGGMLDPYGNPYRYLPAIVSDKTGKVIKGGSGDKMRKDHNLVPVNTDYDLYSMGKDGESKAPFTAKPSQDDIVRANNGQFIGLVSAY